MSAPDEIRWSERDRGQRFSLTMAAIMMLALAVFIGHATFTAALEGDWERAALAGVVFLPLISVCLHWRRRSAR